MDLYKIEKEWVCDYIIHWRPIDMCNYDCSYCSPNSHKRIIKKDFPNVQKLINATKRIQNSITNGKKLHVYITGGEPFLIPDIHEWFNYMSMQDFIVGIFTNGSMPISVYEKCKDYYKNINFKISFHPETADIDHIVNLCRTVKNGGGNIEIRAMLVNKLFHKIAELETKVKEFDIPVTKLPVFPLYNKKLNVVNPTYASSRDLIGYTQTIDNGSLGYYTEEELLVVKNTDEEFPSYLDITVNNNVKSNAAYIVKNGFNKFKGWKCGINNKKLFIFPNGDLQYGMCGNDGIIGNIFEEDVNLFKNKLTICKKSECHTIDEVTVTKFKEN